MRFLFRKLSTCTRCAGVLKLPFVNWNIPWLYCIFIQKRWTSFTKKFLQNSSCTTSAKWLHNPWSFNKGKRNTLTKFLFLMQYMFVCVSSEAKSVHPMLKPYLWGTSHLFAPAECFLVSSLRNLRSASLIEYHNFLHLHSPFFADFFFRFISVTLFCLRISTHNLFYWFCVLTFTVHF